MCRIFKVVLFLLLLILSFGYFEETLLKKYNPVVDYAYKEIPKNNLDLLFVGSSRNYCTYNPKIFDNYLKIYSYNLGTDGQPFSATNAAIYEILKKQNPKIIIIDIYPLIRKPEDYNVRQHYDNMDWSLNKIKLLKNSFPISKWGIRLFNTFYYHDRWKEYKKLGWKNRKTELENIKNYKGFIGYQFPLMRNNLDYDLYEKTYKNIPSDYFPNISEDYLKLFVKLLKVCKEKDIKVILSSPPVVNHEEIYSVFNNPYLSKIIKEFDIDILNFNDGNQKFEHIHFLDNGHLSLSGADIVSFQVAKYIEKKYLNLFRENHYEEDDESVEYYFYNNNSQIKNTNKFKIFELDETLEKGIHVDKLKIYKKDEENFDVYLHIENNRENLYYLSLDNQEKKLFIDGIKLYFNTVKKEKHTYPKYYIREIAGETYIYKRNIKIDKKSKYYF